MNRYLLEEPREAPLPSRLRHPRAWRHARNACVFERRCQDGDQKLAWRVQDVLIGRGLTQYGYSIGGGRSLHIPQVISMTAGPPVELNIRILPGQIPDDFTANLPAIAYTLELAEVRLVQLEPPLIRLVLLSVADLLAEAAVEEPTVAIVSASRAEHEESVAVEQPSSWPVAETGDLTTLSVNGQGG